MLNNRTNRSHMVGKGAFAHTRSSITLIHRSIHHMIDAIAETSLDNGTDDSIDTVLPRRNVAYPSPFKSRLPEFPRLGIIMHPVALRPEVLHVDDIGEAGGEPPGGHGAVCQYL